jgi:hypothetical protein
MSPFFLQGKALGPSLVALLTTKKMKMVMKELFANPLNGEMDFQCNGANVLLSRMESLKQYRQHNITLNSLRK